MEGQTETWKPKRRRTRPRVARVPPSDALTEDHGLDEFAAGRKAIAAEVENGSIGLKKECPMPRPRWRTSEALGPTNHDRGRSERGKSGSKRES